MSDSVVAPVALRALSRRRFVIALAGWYAMPARAQPTAPVVGLLWNDTSKPSRLRDLWLKSLASRGYVVGRNLRIVDRISIQGYGRIDKGAAELVGANVDLILTYGGTATITAAKATRNIPIVFITGSDLVAAGVIKSVAHPGGNATGISTTSRELTGKRLQLMKEMFPGARRLGLLYVSRSLVAASYLRDAQDAARTLGFNTIPLEVKTADELEAALAQATQAKVEVLFVVPSTLLDANSGRLAALALAAGVPVMSPFPLFPEVGGLMSYAASTEALVARAADYAERILKGARPSDLPVEEAWTFELVINRKTAAALGVRIPQGILLRANRVID